MELPDKIKQEIAKYADATANSAITCRILAFKSNIELKGDQVLYLQTKLGRLALENSKKGTSAEQLLAYLDSREDISYICVFDKVKSKLFKFSGKGRPSKQQTVCELSKLSKKKKKKKREKKRKRKRKTSTDSINGNNQNKKKKHQSYEHGYTSTRRLHGVKKNKTSSACK